MSRYLIEIDRSACTGYGVCELEAPALFQVDEEGIAVALDAQTGDAAVLAAAKACPMGAIRVIDTLPGRLAA